MDRQLNVGICCAHGLAPGVQTLSHVRHEHRESRARFEGYGASVGAPLARMIAALITARCPRRALEFWSPFLSLRLACAVSGSSRPHRFISGGASFQSQL